MEGTIRQGARITALAFIGPEGGDTELGDLHLDMIHMIYEKIDDDDLGNIMNTSTRYRAIGEKYLPAACDRYLQQTDKIQDICETPKNPTQFKCKEQLGMCDKVQYSFDQLIEYRNNLGVYRIPHGVEVVAGVQNWTSYDSRYHEMYPWTKGRKYDETIRTIIIPDTAREIGPFAFAECHKLLSITLPNSVKTIGKGAFDNCWDLNSATLPRHFRNEPEMVQKAFDAKVVDKIKYR